jgi:hypothetical protein
MPGGDRTGPLGAGPRTGRAAGFCAGFRMPGYANPNMGSGYGRGYGRGFGRGFNRGFRNRGWDYYGIPSWGAPPNMPFGYNQPYYEKAAYADELEQLRSQEKYLDDSLRELRERIKNLEQK